MTEPTYTPQAAREPLYTPMMGNSRPGPWQSLADPEGLARDAPYMEASRGLAFRELFVDGGMAQRLGGWLEADRRRLFDQQRQIVFGGEVGAPLSVEEANEQYGVPGRLSFDKPIYEGHASWRQSLAQRSAYVEEVVANADLNTWEKIGASFAGSVLDPVALPLWLVPELAAGRALRAGAMAGRLGRLGAVERGAITGAAEGLAGGVLVEGANLWLTHEANDEWDFGQAVTNVLLGGALGGVLGGAGGWFSEGRQARAPQIAHGMSEDARLGAFAEAFEAVSEDRPVSLAAGFRRQAEADMLDLDAVAAATTGDGVVVRDGMTARRWGSMGDEARLAWVAEDQLKIAQARLKRLEGETFPLRIEGEDYSPDGLRSRRQVARLIGAERARIAELEGRIERQDFRDDRVLRAMAGVEGPQAARAIQGALDEWSAKGGEAPHPAVARISKELSRADAAAGAAAPAAKLKTPKGERALPRGDAYADPEVAALRSDTEGLAARAGVQAAPGPREPQAAADAIAAAAACLSAAAAPTSLGRAAARGLGAAR